MTTTPLQRHAEALFGELGPTWIHQRGRIVYANAQLGHLLGVEALQLIGRPAFDLIPEAEHASVLLRLQASACRGGPARAARRLLRATGDTVDVEAALLLVPLEADDPLVVEVFQTPSANRR